MSQLSLIFEPAPARSYTAARKAGDRAGNLAADKAEREANGFRERATAFVLGYLQQHGVSSGELITDAAKLAGIKPPDDRAFGPVYKSLALRGLIAQAGWCLRRKGNCTGGGRLWRLA